MAGQFPAKIVVLAHIQHTRAEIVDDVVDVGVDTSSCDRIPVGL